CVILFFLTLKIGFMLSVREAMCEFGTGNAKLTRFCYFMVLPVFTLYHLVTLVSGARSSYQAETDGVAANAEIDQIFKEISTPNSAAVATALGVGELASAPLTTPC